MKKFVCLVMTVLVIILTTGAATPAYAEGLLDKATDAESVEVGVTLDHNGFSCDTRRKIDIGTPPASPYPFGSLSSAQPTGEGIIYKDGAWWWISSSDRIDETAIFQIFNWRIEAR